MCLRGQVTADIAGSILLPGLLTLEKELPCCEDNLASERPHHEMLRPPANSHAGAIVESQSRAPVKPSDDRPLGDMLTTTS